MSEGDSHPRGTRRLREPQKGLVANLDGLGAKNAGEASPVREGNRQRHAPETAAEGVAHEDEQHHMGHAHHQVDEPAHDGVRRPSAECRSEREHKRDRPRAGRGRKAHPNRGRETRDRAGEHIAPHPIGPEQMGEARRQVLLGKVGRCGLRAHDVPAHDNEEEQRAGGDQARSRPPTVAPGRHLGSMKEQRRALTFARFRGHRGVGAHRGVKLTHRAAPFPRGSSGR